MKAADSVKALFTLANSFKEGDLLVGGTRDEEKRRIAREELAGMTIKQISEIVFVEDRLSELLIKSLNRNVLKKIGHLRILELKTILTGENLPSWVSHHGISLSSEVVAAVVKIMTNAELSKVARRLYNPAPVDSSVPSVTIGSFQHLGSRIQPNSPGDDEDEILFSILEGLCYGCGDVIIGINPASDDLNTIISLEKLLSDIVRRLGLPTRYSVLTDLFKQKAASEVTKVDVGFQSLAGTSKCLEGMLGCDVDELMELCKNFNGLYFETGQGSELTNGTAEGIDMVTLESRCYGLARLIRKETGKWMILNDVAGFIGPEVFSTGEQLYRTCLEDTVMAKLHGLTMGLDVCSTFHMGIHPTELKVLTRSIALDAAPAYLMGVAGNADPMLGYLTTSYRDHQNLRKCSGKKIASAMEIQLVKIGALTSEGAINASLQRLAALYARYQKVGGSHKDLDELATEAVKIIKRLQKKGCDIGYGTGQNGADPDHMQKRLNTLFEHSRKALYAIIEPDIMKEAAGQLISVSSRSENRDDFLAHPVTGEGICQKDVIRLKTHVTSESQRSRVQLIIADGLNANAVNQHIKHILPALRKSLTGAGISVSNIDIEVKNGRVRAGYHIGQILFAEMIILLIGERPGTGLNQLSAYITYGKDLYGNTIFSPDMEHSLTTAVCGIHPQGKSYITAIKEITGIVVRALEERMTGVKLGTKK